MTSSRERRAALCLLLVGCLGGALQVACGSSDDGAPAGTGPDGSTPGTDGGTSGADGGMTGSDSGGPSVNGPLTFRDRLAGWSNGYTGGWYGGHGYPISNKRLFSIPDALSASLGAVTVVDVSAAKAKVIALPVTGKVPTGTVESFTYEPSSDRMVLVVRTSRPAAVQIVTIALSATEATFTTLTQANTGAVDATNSLIGPLFATGGGAIVAGLGNSVASFTIAGTTATWSAATTATLFHGNGSPMLEDPTHGRLLAYGKEVFDPTTMTASTDPAIETLALAPPYVWSSLPSGGNAPPSTMLNTGGYAVYDATGNRVIVSVLHDSQCAGTACKIPGLWSFDLGTNAWSSLADAWTNQHAYSGYGPYLVDQSARRVLEPSDGILLATSLDTTTNPTLAGAIIDQDGDLGPRGGASTVLGDGRIVSTDSAAFRVLDPSGATARWERFGTASMPSLAEGFSIAADPQANDVLVVGMTNSGATLDVYALAKDGKTIPKVTATGSPPARASFGALVADGTLYIAGGTSGSSELDDVWAFDRASSSWTMLATLPGKVTNVSLGLAANGDLLVAGRFSAPGSGTQTVAKSSPIFAVDRKSHAVKSMTAVTSTVPLWSTAPYRGCFIGYESGDTYDNTAPNLWRCSIDNGTITWTSTAIDEHDFALTEVPGTASADGLHAYFPGSHLWEAIGK
jgi:hypothetical protein